MFASGSKKQKLLFEEWIDEVGQEKLASILNVTKTTIGNWRAGRCDPRFTHMRAIKKLAKGRLGYDDIVDRAFTYKEVVTRQRVSRSTGRK